MVHTDHSLFGAGLNDTLDLRYLILSNLVRYRRCIDHDLSCRYATTADPGQESLRDNASQGHGQLHAHLALLMRWERVNYTIDGLCRIVSMESGKYEMPGLRQSDRSRDRFQIAHLAHHDHIRILSHRVLQARGKRLDVSSQFTLDYHALLGSKHEFYRIFEGNDIRKAIVIDVFYHRTERGRFTATSRTGQQDESLLKS